MNALEKMEHAGSRHGDGPAEQRMTPGAMMRSHHDMARWVHPVIAIAGAWLITSPATFGYESLALTVSDIASGTALIILAAFAYRGSMVAGWLHAGVGTWLLFAPLVFSAPTAAAYANDSLMGVVVIAFGILVPHGMKMEGPEIPPGWSYNPSTWTQRAPIVVLALIGLFISRYLAAFQLGYIDTVWEPFFDTGTHDVLTSDISRAFPVSDAGLGAVAYTIELLMTLMGGHRRWRTMPWMVAFFGIVVIPLGAVQIVLIVLQPLAVGAWCTLCLVSAAGMLLMIPLAFDEVVAMGQVVSRGRSAGRSFWNVFWMGESLDGEDRPSPGRGDPKEPYAMIWGMSFPPALLGATALGIWLMFAPSVFGSTGAAADSDHLMGALIVTVAVIALAEPARTTRYLNVPLGAWVAIAPWILGGASIPARLNATLVGVLVAALSLPRGIVRDRYAGWDAAIR